MQVIETHNVKKLTAPSGFKNIALVFLIQFQLNLELKKQLKKT